MLVKTFVRWWYGLLMNKDEGILEHGKFREMMRIMDKGIAYGIIMISV